MAIPRTLFEKVWEQHIVAQEPDSPAVLYIDLHLIHEVTSPQAFDGLRRRNLSVRRPERTVATMDHSIPTTDPSVPLTDAQAAAQMKQLETNAAEFGIRLYGMQHAQRGIVHVIGPELGLTQPGMTIVCGDSHTVGVTAKDIILALLAKIGVGGGTGHVIEYTGSAIRALSMESRMTICNMSIEGGARAGMIAPDEKTYAYLVDRECAPKGKEWDRAIASWSALPTDPGASYDSTVILNASDVVPMITYGTNPGMGMKITDRVPDPDRVADASERATLEKALRYMGLQPGEALLNKPVDVVFIGSCTNSRISDLREAVFKKAGAEWRESGCSMCIAMNGDEISAGQYAVSTSNRNFEGRQGKGGRTFLASPLTAAATAVTGSITDVRTLLHP
ncbi:MAG: aconitase family protein [Bacteroidetes bacterium]|nr:aconitase family protein [Bacteroidota bacterium]